MSKLFNLVAVLILLLILISGCTTPLRLNISQSRYDLPEVVGDSDTALEFGILYDEYAVTFTEDAENIPVETDTPLVDKVDPDSYAGSDTFWKFGIYHGFTEWLELSYKLDVYHTFGSKIQLLGEPRSKSKKGNYSAAVTLSFSATQTEDDENGNTDASVESRFQDYALLLGYRPHDRALLYTSVFRTRYDYNIEIEPLAINGNRERFSGDVDVNGYAVGFNYDFTDTFFITIELLKSTLETGSVELDESFYGINFGIKN